MTTKATPQFTADDDNFDSIPTQAAQTSTPTQTQFKPVSPETVQKHLANQAAKPAESEFSLDDDNVGEQLKSADFLPTLKISKGEVARFSLIPQFKVKSAMTHYREGSGTFRCLSTEGNKAVCCVKSGDPKPRYVALIYRYTNVDPKTGKFLDSAKTTGPVVEVQAIRLSRSNMRDMLDACEDGQSAYDVDLRIKHAEDKAFGYKVSRAGSKPSWKALPAESLPSLEAYADGTRLASRLGKTLNEVELKVLLSTGAASESQASVATLSSVMDEE